MMTAFQVDDTHAKPHLRPSSAPGRDACPQGCARGAKKIIFLCQRKIGRKPDVFIKLTAAAQCVLTGLETAVQWAK